MASLPSMRPLRILKVIHDFLPRHRSGSELYCFHLARELMRRHQVYVLFTEVDHSRPQFAWRRSSYLGLPTFEVVHNHVHRTFEDTYVDSAMDRIFTRILDEVRPDVLHVHHLMHHSANYLHIARRRGIRVVFTLHDYWLSCPNFGQRMRRDLEVCDEIDPDHCAECVSGLTGGAAPFFVTKLASRALGMLGDGGYSLLDRLGQARVTTPEQAFVRADRLDIDGDSRRVVVAHPPARLGFKVKVGEGTRLRFGFAMAPATFETATNGVTFEVRADGRLLWTRALDPRHRASERCWNDVEVPLPPSVNGGLDLELVTRPTANGTVDHCSAAWSGLHVLSPSTAPAQVAPVKAAYRRVLRLLSTDGHGSRKDMVAERLRRVRAACESVDLFLAPSAFLQTKMLEFGLPPERLVRSDYGVAPAVGVSARTPMEAGVRFGYVGTLAPHKGVHLAIEAFHHLRPPTTGPGAVLKIHGNASWFPAYVKRLQALAAGLPVEFCGEFDEAHTGEAFAGLDVLLVPSLWWENAPLTIHEAALMGVPVLAADFGGMAEFVREGVNGRLFRRGDAADLARLMQEIVDRPAVLEELRTPAFALKTIAEDAAGLEREYLRLVDRAREVEGSA
jgi:glycosyltransferase involved in cell wall biosynthesis